MTLSADWFTVEQRGYDSSGRPLRNTKYMWAIFEALREHPSIRPFGYKLVLVQGAFMSWNGGGASRSDGFHDLGGCNDLRTWNLTNSEISVVIRVARSLALGAWRRDLSYRHGGMAEHIHWGQGGDRPQSYGSSLSWRSYVAGGDGLSGTAGDYEGRPSPLVVNPPSSIFIKELTMDAEVRAAFAHLNDRLSNIKDDLNADIADLANAEQRRAIEQRKTAKAAEEKAKSVSRRVIAKLGGVQDSLAQITALVDEGNIKDATVQLHALTTSTRMALAEDPDIDGVDNPADRSA